MAKPFDECWQRIERAKTHSAAAAQAWNAFIEDEGAYEVDVDVDPSGDGAIWIEQASPIPSVIAFEIGEFLYQMRAALDHCVYEAACLTSGLRPPPAEDSLEFFIRDTPKKFEAAAARKLVDLGPAQRRIIELFQPFNAPQGLAPNELPYNYNRGLSILNDWARKDRHRKLHVIGTWTSNIEPMFRLPEGTALRDFTVPVGEFVLRGRTKIATFHIENWKLGLTLSANPNLTFDLTVDEDPRPCHDADNMNIRFQCIIRAVAELVGAIASTFDPELFK